MFHVAMAIMVLDRQAADLAVANALEVAGFSDTWAVELGGYLTDFGQKKSFADHPIGLDLDGWRAFYAASANQTTVEDIINRLRPTE